MRLTEIQKRLRELSIELACYELYTLAGHISRRKPRKRAKQTATSLTPLLIQQIKTFHANNPGISQREIAEQFHVNPGRVSEILRGKRQ